MTVVLLCLIALQPPAVSLPSAYYSYRTLAVQLESQGIRLDTTHAPDRTFVISFDHGTTAELMESLSTSSGDEIDPVDGAWVIRPVASRVNRNHELAKKYINDLEGQVDMGLSTATWDGGLERRIGKLVVEQLQHPKWWQNERAEVGAFLDFAKDLITLTDEEGQGDARFLCRALSIDPQSPNALQRLGQCSTAVGFGFQPELGNIAGECLLAPQNQLLYCCCSMWPVPRFTSATCQWANYLSNLERTALERRRDRTLTACRSPLFGDRVDRRKPQRPSTRILEWAKANHGNVVFQVNPLLDRPRTTIASSVGEWLASMSRLDSDQQPKASLSFWPDSANPDERSALTPNNCLNVSQIGDTTVVTDEMAFLNEFCEISESSALAIDNGHGTLADLESAAISSAWSKYRGGSYCVGLSNLGDFPGACPFLALLAKDRDLNAKVESLKEGESTDKAFSDLPPKSQKPFLESLSNCAQYVSPDPDSNLYAARLFARLPDASKRIRTMTLTFKRVAGRLRVALATAAPERYEIWYATLKVNAP